jgi:hypothetical protein
MLMKDDTHNYLLITYSRSRENVVGSTGVHCLPRENAHPRLRLVRQQFTSRGDKVALYPLDVQITILVIKWPLKYVRLLGKPFTI